MKPFQEVVPDEFAADVRRHVEADEAELDAKAGLVGLAFEIAQEFPLKETDSYMSDD